MRHRIFILLIMIAMMAGIGASLAGCGGANSDTASDKQSQATKAAVTFAVTFPGTNGAVKSLIPLNAQVVEVYARSTTSPPTYDPNNPNSQFGTLLATLSPTLTSATVQMTPGLYMVYALAYDSADVASRTMIGETFATGEIKSGQANTIVLTFMNGQWTLVDASNSAAPITLSDGTVLNDFVIQGNSDVRFRFGNYTSARTSGGMVAIFSGATNNSILYAEGYNLTKNCSTYNSQACDESPGDQILMVSGKDSTASTAFQGIDMFSGNLLQGSGDTLLPNNGRDMFTQNGVALDLMSAMPDTVVTGGNLITGGIVEWKPLTDRVTTLATAPVAKMVKSALAIKAQSTNTSYSNLTVKSVEALVCSGTNPQNRGTWSFANNSSAGKLLLGNKVCYSTSGSQSIYLNNQYDPVLMQQVANAGDYSYGFAPTDINNLGDYCHEWDNMQYIYTSGVPTANPAYNTCKKQLPGTDDVYKPDNFMAVKSASKTAINYGSFKFNFWGETAQTGTAYIYPFRAKGSTALTPAK